MSSRPDLDQLQRRIGYQFRSPERLLLALTHRSYGNQNNERLEFLGDSIVNMVIAEYLYLHFEKARDVIVCERLRLHPPAKGDYLAFPLIAMLLNG